MQKVSMSSYTPNTKKLDIHSYFKGLDIYLKVGKRIAYSIGHEDTKQISPLKGPDPGGGQATRSKGPKAWPR